MLTNQSFNKKIESYYSINDLADYYCVSLSLIIDSLVDMKLLNAKTHKLTKLSKDKNILHTFSDLEISFFNPYSHKNPLDNIYFNKGIVSAISVHNNDNSYFKVGILIRLLMKYNHINNLNDITSQEKSLKFKSIYISKSIYTKNKEDKIFILNLRDRLEETNLLDLSSKFLFFGDLNTRYNNYKLEKSLIDKNTFRTNIANSGQIKINKI